MCWFCHWGWPKPVADIYDHYLPIAGESAMHYGAAHIVWDDENFERHHVQWCLDHFDEHTREDCTTAENEAVRDSLKALLALPDDVLYPPAAHAYQDTDAGVPADFPPPSDLAMVRR